MKNFLPLTFCFLFLASLTQAQNLVPNPSFEDHITCPNSSSQMFYAVPWSQPPGHQGTSDYFHECCVSPIPLQSPPVGVPANLLGNQAARTGDAYGGFFSIDGPTDGDYREYVQAPLTTPLTIGVRYCVRFYVSLSDNSTNSTNGIGAYFSTQPVSGPGSLPLQFNAQVTADSIIRNYTGWQEVYGEFVADQAYSYITIGNFITQGQTSIGAGAPANPNQVPPTLPMPGAYYFLDDVEVYTAATCPVPCNIEFTNASTVADCNMNNGVAAVNVLNGSGNYTYLWETGATTATLPGVGYGLYEVTVDDGPGCSRSVDVFVGQNSTLALSFSPGFLQCASEPDGDIDITVTGGTAPYTFLWSTGDTTEDIDSLVGGTYTVVVTDAAGCMLTDSMELTSIFGSESTVVATNESCAGANNGSLYVQPGGTFPFPPTAYLWSNGATTAGIYNLAPGTYTVDVTDFFGCVTTLTGTVGSGTGSFTVNISQQGNTLYSTTAPNYQWYHNDNLIPGATQQTYTISASGYYYVVASGGGNCIDTSNVIETSFNPDNILENNLIENVLVFPNPANENLNVVMSLTAPEATEIKLMDITGRVIWSFKQELKTTKFQCIIPVSAFAEGVYFVQANAGAQQKYIKVIVK